MSLNVCVFGVSGYTGSKLLYYLNKHKKIKISGVFGNSKVGENFIKKIRKLERMFFDNQFGIFDLICIEKI